MDSKESNRLREGLDCNLTSVLDTCVEEVDGSGCGIREQRQERQYFNRLDMYSSLQIQFLYTVPLKEAK